MGPGERYGSTRQGLTDRHHRDNRCPACGLIYQTRYYCELKKTFMYRHPPINRRGAHVRGTKYCEAQR